MKTPAKPDPAPGYVPATTPRVIRLPPNRVVTPQQKPRKTVDIIPRTR